MPLSVINRHGSYDTVMIEAYCAHGGGKVTPYLFAERSKAPRTVMTVLMMAPSGVIADAIEEERGHTEGNRIEELIHYLRTGEHTWRTGRVITSLRHSELDGQRGYTPYTVTEVERRVLDRVIRREFQHLIE